jgi:phosphohistidine phosphatase
VKLILIRHAAAIERHPDIAEGNRYLTPEGRAFFRKTARTMGDHGLAPDLILTSPLLRAVQTADILAESLVYSGPLQVVEGLSPGCTLATVMPLLDQYRQAREVVLVGHEPDLGSLVAELLHLSHGFSFKKGSAVRLNLEMSDLQPTAVFKWLACGRKLIKSREEACR